MELIQNILVTALLGIWACLSIGFFVWLVQGISNDCPLPGKIDTKKHTKVE